jgi:hypothetical protein
LPGRPKKPNLSIWCEGGGILKEQRKCKPGNPAWQPGVSGNPKGRTPGSGEVGKLRAAIAEHVPAIVAKLVEMAKAGDAGAARLLLERTLAPLKATDQAAPVALAGAALAEQGRAIVAAAGAGALTPSQAVQYLTGLGALAKLIETDELAARVAALEGKHGPAEGLV